MFLDKLDKRTLLFWREVLFTAFPPPATLNVNIPFSHRRSWIVKKGTLAAAVLAGLVLGFALSPLVRQPEAQAADKHARHWEYQIIPTSPHPREGAPRVERPRDTVERLNKEFNRLAAEGWEHAGRVFVGANNATFVLFKRVKE